LSYFLKAARAMRRPEKRRADQLTDIPLIPKQEADHPTGSFRPRGSDVETGILKIGKTPGVRTALVRRVVMEQSRPQA
jgi:hypothetical protein